MPILPLVRKFITGITRYMQYKYISYVYKLYVYVNVYSIVNIISVEL